MCPRKGAIQKCFDKRDFELIPQALRNRTLCLHQAWCCSQSFEIWAPRSAFNHVSQARLLILQASDVSSAKKVYMCAPADQAEFLHFAFVKPMLRLRKTTSEFFH